MVIILQLKVADNNTLEKNLVNYLVKSQLDDLAKIFADSEDAST